MLRKPLPLLMAFLLSPMLAHGKNVDLTIKGLKGSVEDNAKAFYHPSLKKTIEQIYASRQGFRDRLPKRSMRWVITIQPSALTLLKTTVN